MSTVCPRARIRQGRSALASRWKKLDNARSFKEFTKTWAIDRDRNCYLLKMPYPAREEMNDSPFYAFVGGRMYRINRIGQAGNKVYFDELSLPSQDILAVIEAEIAAAFAVYGTLGKGPLNSDGYPTLVLVPVFTKKGPDHGPY